MSEQAAATTHPFRCWTVNEADVKKTYVGGSYDNISAVTIACAAYGSIQGYSTSPWMRVVVFDSTDTPVAFIGAARDAPPQTAPVGPAPTLASLEPDSSGNWTAEVRLLGTGFTQTSEVLANGNPVTPVTYVSATELRVIVPVSAAGAYTVAVRNGSQVSNTLTFTAL